MNISYKLASPEELEVLIDLVGEYHIFESLSSSRDKRRTSLIPLLDPDKDYGFILVAFCDSQLVGYVAICYGYTIEFGGRDAFVDEFYVMEKMRNKGIGFSLLEKAKIEALKNSINVLHLEVAVENATAKSFYKKNGFLARENFHLMSCRLR